LLGAYAAALAAVDGHRVVAQRLRREPLSGPVYVIALGKAAEAMASGALDVLGDRIAGAFLVAKTSGHSLPWPVHTGGHPVPDERSLDAGRALDDFLATIPADSTVLVLLSGGASSLIEQLPKGITLSDLQRVNEWLLASGLDIHAMNRVRRRLSRLKGGQLAARLAGHRVLGLVISDVPGDDLRSIASGPLTAPGAGDAPPAGLPAFVEEILARAPATAPGGLSPMDLRVERVAGNEDARRAAVEWAVGQGQPAHLESRLITGDAADAGLRLAKVLLESPPGVLHAWGGEATVRLPAQPGRGGRAQHLALSAARVLSGHEEVYLLAAGSDGSDGPGEDAGALVDGGTLARGEPLAGSATEALARADAGTFLEVSGDLIQTGPTGTNVMDLMLGWRRK
jgi:hydroxypyruvate reductase